MDDILLQQARRVRDWLAERYLHLPGVTLIDIGYTGSANDNRGADRFPVIRIHVTDKATLQSLDLPKEVEGIPIQVMIADYKLE